MPQFANPEDAEFARLLVTGWRGEGCGEMVRLLVAIASGELEAEFKIPTSEAELIEWLEMSHLDAAPARDTHTTLLQIAKAGSTKYLTSIPS